MYAETFFRSRYASDLPRAGAASTTPQAGALMAVTLAVLLGQLSAPQARAQSLHFDVEIRTSHGPVAGSALQVSFFGDNALLINGQAAFDHGTGYGIWPANFGDTPGGPYATDDPGFQAFAGTLLAGERIFYRPIGTALHWQSAARTWQAAPAGTNIRIEGTVPSEIAINALVFNDPAALAQYAYYTTPTSITGNGVAGPLTKMVDEAAPNGSFHTHLNWFLEGDRPPGAYMAQMQLFDPGGKYRDSTPFFILFNHGLSSGDYESAFISRIQAPLPAVPEPQTLWLMLAALPCVLLRRLLRMPRST